MKGVHINAPVILLLILGFQDILTIAEYDERIDTECTVTDFSKLDDAVQNCDIIIIDTITVPAGKTLNLPLRDGTSVYFKGVITFEYAVWAGPLVAINGTNVTIVGETGSVLDGQGQLYWDGQGEWGSLKPKFFIIQLHDSVMRDIYVLNSPVHCVLLEDSTNVQLLDWIIDNLAGDPENAGEGKYGHNTDGFDIWNSTNIELKNTQVYNQDDCVAVRCGANILVDSFYCHGGHGLSISVGFSNDSVALNTLQNVTMINSILSGGQNGIHLKTHVDAGDGLMENITYENIVFRGPVNYGVNIQQNYRNLPANSTLPTDPKNNIPIRSLTLKDINGRVEASAVPIYILCADEGCFDWSFANVAVNGTNSNNCNYVPANFSC